MIGSMSESFDSQIFSQVLDIAYNSGILKKVAGDLSFLAETVIMIGCIWSFGATRYQRSLE